MGPKGEPDIKTNSNSSLSLRQSQLSRTRYISLPFSQKDARFCTLLQLYVRLHGGTVSYMTHLHSQLSAVAKFPAGT
jgi:hypothetical protein